MDPAPVFYPLEEALCRHRNIWCPHYDSCLTEAARRNCQFDCGDCPFRMEKVAQFELTWFEIQGCHHLLGEIFCLADRPVRAS